MEPTLLVPFGIYVSSISHALCLQEISVQREEFLHVAGDKGYWLGYRTMARIFPVSYYVLSILGLWILTAFLKIRASSNRKNVD